MTDALGHVVAYSYDADGYLTKVVDADGHQTTYTYSNDSLFDKDNLTSTTDSNGWAAITRDTAHYLALRQDLGFVYKAGDALPPGKAIGDAKLVASLTQAEKDAILARFTTTFTYDARGNLLSRRDGAGNLTTYTYTSFNKVATMTAPMGDALATSDEASYQAKRVELGFAATVAGLSAANKAALRALYTTTYTYDAQAEPGDAHRPGRRRHAVRVRRLRQCHAAHRRLSRRQRSRERGEEPGHAVRLRRLRQQRQDRRRRGQDCDADL